MKAVALLLVFAACVFGQATLYATVTPQFTNTAGTSLYYYCSNVPPQQTCSAAGFGSVPPAQGRWGRPSSGNDISGLGFTPPSQIVITFPSATSSSDFFLGNLTHFNWPIQAAASSTHLLLELVITTAAGTELARKVFDYTFVIDETTNRDPVSACPYPSITPCSDKITFVNGGFDFRTSIQVNAVNYTLQLLGFKESAFSGSTPRDSFISQENNQQTGYLFAQLALACPSNCVGGGNFILLPNGDCACNCTNAAACPYPGMVRNPDCSCACPSNITCLNGGTLNANCTCSCPTCIAPKLTLSNCGCQCPTGICGACGIFVGETPTGCNCSCANCPACPLPNYVRGPNCTCVCPITNATCAAQNPLKIEDPSEVCGCTCSPAARAACTGNFVLNTTTCQCDCPANLCPNGQTRFANNCTCGACSPSGNWIKNNVTGLCTTCGLTSCPSSGETIDTDVCQCVCSQLVCNKCQDGLVVDITKPCACRNCTAGECCCGNGRLEPGEACEPKFPGDPCCVNCQFTNNACNDSNLCTELDYCNGTGFCVGQYKCLPNTECKTITCNPSVGTCDETFFAPGTPCGPDMTGRPGQKDLCNYRCSSGLCNNAPVTCTDPIADDCFYPICDSTTGLCSGNGTKDPGSPCTDGDPCTFDDKCDASGTCSGTPIVCSPSTNECTVSVCLFGACTETPVQGQKRCNFDNNNCTQGDYCDNGVCREGRPVSCPKPDVCTDYLCDMQTGSCYAKYKDNTTCNDGNVCTENDICIQGSCKGEVTEATSKLTECGYIPPTPPKSRSTTPIIIISVAGAAALIGAIIGAAFLIKKIRDSKLTDPDTWNPDTFSSIGANPLYKGSVKSVDNRLYEGAK